MAGKSHPYTLEQTGGHTCHAQGCEVPVYPRFFMCRAHWPKLSKFHRDQIISLYRDGQEVRKDPTIEYVRAAQRAIIWLANKEGRGAPTLFDVTHAS